MEYQEFEQITVVKVRKLCCEAYQKKLQKKLLKHEGVTSVEIKPEKRVVLVGGKVDPISIVNLVARTGKHAEIVGSYKKSSLSKCCNDSQPSCCYRNDHKESHKTHQEEEQPHKCEDYAPSSFDFFCRPNSWRPAPPGFSGHAGGGPFRHDPRWFPDRRRHRPVFYDYGFFH